jgi:hypothetical protein
MKTNLLVLALAAALGSGCAGEIRGSFRRYAGPRPPSLGMGCPLTIVRGPAPAPGPGVVALGHVQCRFDDEPDRDLCRGEVRRLACEGGGNTIAAIVETAGRVEAEVLWVDARLASAPVAPPMAPVPANPPVGAPPPPIVRTTMTPPPQPPPPPPPVVRAPPPPPPPPLGPPPPPPGEPPEQLPITLNREDVVAGMTLVRNQVLFCMRQEGRTEPVTVSVEIEGTGRVRAARVEGDVTGTPLASCIEGALTRASFRRFSGRNVTVRYPFAP